VRWHAGTDVGGHSLYGHDCLGALDAADRESWVTEAVVRGVAGRAGARQRLACRPTMLQTETLVEGKWRFSRCERWRGSGLSSGSRQTRHARAVSAPTCAVETSALAPLKCGAGPGVIRLSRPAQNQRREHWLPEVQATGLRSPKEDGEEEEEEAIIRKRCGLQLERAHVHSPACAFLY